MLTSAVENLTSYLGSVWMRPSLEVDDTIGVSRARFCVFFHWPFLGRWSRQAGVFTQLHIRVFGGQAGCEANMLPDQAPTAAPGEGTRIHFNSYLPLIITATKKQACRKHDCNNNCAPSFFSQRINEAILKKQGGKYSGSALLMPVSSSVLLQLFTLEASAPNLRPSHLVQQRRRLQRYHVWLLRSMLHNTHTVAEHIPVDTGSTSQLET